MQRKESLYYFLIKPAKCESDSPMKGSASGRSEMGAPDSTGIKCTPLIPQTKYKDILTKQKNENYQNDADMETKI
uniref:SFRICE_016650 n=1 Tax=Spodoptera frugiperda TaxID=7108 RepID=A0A2H1VR90_SPOFR